MSVLFLEDWVDQSTGKPVACVHKTTTNKSFLRMAVVLSKMGIKNNLFHLSLYDPKLLKVNPHELDPTTDPTGEMRLRVALECKRNLWYYLREVIRIPASGGDPVQFKLNRGNLAMSWCFANYIDYNGTQCRQSGKGTPATTKIKTPTGWALLGDLCVGDYVVAIDGSPTKIVGVYPQGMKPLFKLTFEDGRTAVCDNTHLWKVCVGDTWAVLETEKLYLKQSDNMLHIPLFKEGKESFSDDVGRWFSTEAEARTYQESIWERGGVCHITPSDDGYISHVLKNSTKLKITNIEKCGVDETICIEVDHPDHLYVIQDHIVTHNTIGAIALTSWVTYVSGVNMSIAMLTHSDKLVQENVKRLKDMRDALPEYLVRKTGDDIDNKQGLDYKSLNNKYLTYIGQKDKIAANKVGRGSTAPVLHFDELAFIPNIRITFPAIMASTNTARQNAAKAGQVHSNLYTTTAGDPSTDEGAYALDILTKSMRFTEHLYDCKDRAAAHEMVAMNSENGLVDGTFSYLQLGYSHEWFKDIIARNNVPPDEVQRDYLNNWITLAKNPIIPKATLEKMGEFRKPDPLYCEIFGEYIVNWYVPRETVNSSEFKKKALILGMDASEMIGRDFTTFVCIDPEDLSVVMTFRCNESNTMKVALFVSDILTEYPRMLFVPERKSTAITIIDTVIVVMQKQGQNPFTRIFNKLVDQKHLEEFSDVSIYDASLVDTSYRKYLGFMTTSSSRNILYKEILQKAAAMSADRVYDPVLINELSGLQSTNGRIDHRVGAHDDMCFIGPTLVRTDTGNRPISELKIGDHVLTREGYKPILHIFKNEKEVISKFGFTGTPNHPFITPSGIVEFKDLTEESIVYRWNEKLSSIEERSITDILTQNDCNTGTISTDTTPLKRPRSRFIDRCISITSEIFRKACMFTTKMETILTTTRQTLNASRQPNIVEDTRHPMQPDRNSLMPSRDEILSENGGRRLQKKLWYTIMQTVEKVKGCITGEKIIRKKPVYMPDSSEDIHRNNAERNRCSHHLSTQKNRSRDPQHSNDSSTQIVYNLHIGECHEYFANDILVHNCMAWMLACYAVFEGKNLHLYGISSDEVLKSIDRTSGKKVDPVHIAKQMSLRKQVKEYENLIKTAGTEYLRQHFKYKLAQIAQYLDESLVLEPVSQDSIRKDFSDYGDVYKRAQEVAARPAVDVGQFFSASRSELWR